MRIIKDRKALKQVSAGRPSAHIPIPCIYLTWRERHRWDGDKFGTREKLDALKSENPDMPVYSEGKDGAIELFDSAIKNDKEDAKAAIGGQNGVA